MSNKAKEDERKFILECIKVYHNLPALWNINCKDYNNRIRKNEQYEQLLSKYREKYPDADKKQLVNKLNSLRTNFRKEWKRINDLEKSGAGTNDVVEPVLWYFEEMKFITSQEEPSSSQSTMNLDEQEHKFHHDNCSLLEISHVEEPPKKIFKKIRPPQKPISIAARTRLQQPQNEFEKIAAAWAVDLMKIKPDQQLFVKKAINDILFEGQMGTLHRGSVQINNNNFTGTSTPYSSVQPSSLIYYNSVSQPENSVHIAETQINIKTE